MTRRLTLSLLLTVAIPAGATSLTDNMRECVSADSIRAESAESESRLILHAGSGRAFISHLPQPCDGLLGVNNLSRLRFNAKKGERICAGHTVTIEPKLGSDTAPVSCKLGPFEAVSEMTISELLRRP